MSKNKAKGTRAESQVVEYLRSIWPHAERRALAGAKDLGDVNPGNGTPCVVEVKDHQRLAIAEWMDELRQEMDNAGAPIGFLVVKRRGKGDPADWYWLCSGPVALDLLNEWGR